MLNWRWKKKEALKEQCSFFGYKPKRFVSVYAKKPRILIKNKDTVKIDLNVHSSNAHLRDQAQAAIGQAAGIFGGLGGMCAAQAQSQADLRVQASFHHAQSQAQNPLMGLMLHGMIR